MVTTLLYKGMTSTGLQLFELFVVSNADIRAKIRAVAREQAQVTDRSHLLIFTGWDDITADRVNIMFDLTNVFAAALMLANDRFRRRNRSWEHQFGVEKTHPILSSSDTLSIETIRHSKLLKCPTTTQ